ALERSSRTTRNSRFSLNRKASCLFELERITPIQGNPGPMRLSSMADYAVVTMSAAARHCGGARVSAADLAEETGLPLPTVHKVTALLGKAGPRRPGPARRGRASL